MRMTRERIEARIASLRVNHIENERIINKWIRIGRRWNKDNPDNKITFIN